MPKLAFPPRWCLFPLLFVLVSLVAQPVGRASTPVSIYTAASAVEMLPSDANATETVIHGAFMFINANGGYSDAVCGAMYFRCPAGSETMCRMQWLDIRTMGTGTSQCAGFGAENAIPTAHIRSEGAALTAPDLWDLGIGVQIGSFIDGKCAAARTMACARPASLDGGTTDVSISADARMTIDGTSSIDETSAIDGTAAPIDGIPSIDGTAPIDGMLRAPDVPARDAFAAPDHGIAVQDASPKDAVVDQNTAAPRDASLPVTDAMDDGTSPESNGCGCRLGGPENHRQAGLPIGLAIFATLFGAVMLRRVR